MKTLTYLLTIVLSLSMLSDVEARRSGGSFGGSRSSSSWGGSRSSSSSSSRSSSWGKSSSNKTTTTRSSSSKPKTFHKAPPRKSVKKTVPKKTISAADKKRISSAKSSGTYFKNRKEATSSFKKKHANTYKSRYATKPTTRPAHIPQTTSVGGRSYNVTYNASYGGYGYMGPSGSWIMYDAMADAAMLAILMNRRGYVCEDTYYTTRTVSQPVVVVREQRTGGCSMGAAGAGTLIPIAFLLGGMGIARIRQRRKFAKIDQDRK